LAKFAALLAPNGEPGSSSQNLLCLVGETLEKKPRQFEKKGKSQRTGRESILPIAGNHQEWVLPGEGASHKEA
jgi:hypothetical protein